LFILRRDVYLFLRLKGKISRKVLCGPIYQFDVESSWYFHEVVLILYHYLGVLLKFHHYKLHSNNFTFFLSFYCNGIIWVFLFNIKYLIPFIIVYIKNYYYFFHIAFLIIIIFTSIYIITIVCTRVMDIFLFWFS